ncbi:uncharacterized protein M421DRAFT_418314 [Didymella exigua CBS 183.55]|uniref:Uncharacterized protein n=1 Tax=Didymella exigua CBS 183.55 TaxID=1150837 RepID=A0A6A5RSS4_9PLEO|nr:uncharacterized protein M421DRAFT_418314 [Didymella exigua CBS 183.55]KAF1930842.1 hypothetical protein M421DRAFT_418314 [Didymella exigua CBS 183.55]
MISISLFARPARPALPLLWLVMRKHTTCKASSPLSQASIHARLFCRLARQPPLTAKQHVMLNSKVRNDSVAFLVQEVQSPQTPHCCCTSTITRVVVQPGVAPKA